MPSTEGDLDAPNPSVKACDRLPDNGGVRTWIRGSVLAVSVVSAGVSCSSSSRPPRASTSSSSLNPTTSGQGSNSTSGATAELGTLTIELSGSPNPVRVGQTLTYTMKVTNRSADPITGAQATDPLPEGASLTPLPISVRSSNTACTHRCSRSSGTVSRLTSFRNSDGTAPGPSRSIHALVVALLQVEQLPLDCRKLL